jgi:hypothetical protein
MGARRLAAGVSALLMRLAVAACGLAVATPARPEAPAGAYAVGVRTLDLRRGEARPLPTIVRYPAAGRGGAVTGRGPVVRGRLPR